MPATASLGEILPLWSVLPFAGVLASLAVLPLAAPRFWHRNFPRVAAGWAVAFAVPFVIAYRGDALHAIAHVAIAEYLPFLVLVGGLYTISGGLVVRGDLRPGPRTNVILLVAGTLLASWIGTTGAAMVLVRPLLRANEGRRHRAHTVVFFIFLVANIGGALTPLGDPPLFLGYLQGVPFFWTLRIAFEMAIAALVLLPVYVVIERRLWRDEPESIRLAPPVGPRQRLALAGAGNVLALAAVLGAVLLSGSWQPGQVSVLGVDLGIQDLARDGLILLAAAASLLFTRRALRQENEFSWGPVREVAYLFAAIFVTMIPAIEILRAGSAGALGPLVERVATPATFFWGTGLLSSVLDNAPTYLAFFSTALGAVAPGVPADQAVVRLVHDHPHLLEAISAGAVFMGANTYIGNAPNFMVKAIAEEAGVPMPSFFGYVLRWTVPVLLPVYVLITFVLALGF